MDVLYTKEKWKFALAYFHNINIFLPTSAKHKEQIGLVLTLPHDTRVTLNLMKCEVFLPNLPYILDI